MCAERGSLGEDQLSPKPWEEGLAQKPATVGPGSCPRRCRRAGRSCHLGAQQHPPPPVNSHSTRGLRRCVCCQRPPHSCFATALGDPLPRAAATFPTPGTAPCLGPGGERSPKRPLLTDAGQGMRPGVKLRPEPHCSQPDNPEGRKHKGFRGESKTRLPPPAPWGAWAPNRSSPPFHVTRGMPLSPSWVSVQSGCHHLPYPPPGNTARAGEKLDDEDV